MKPNPCPQWSGGDWCVWPNCDCPGGIHDKRLQDDVMRDLWRAHGNIWMACVFSFWGTLFGYRWW